MWDFPCFFFTPKPCFSLHPDLFIRTSLVVSSFFACFIYVIACIPVIARHCMYTCHCTSLHVYLSCLLQCVKLVAIAIAFAVVLYVYSILHCFFVQYFPANLIPKIYQLLNPFLCHIPSCRAIVSLISRPVTFSVARKKVTAFA